MSLTSFAQVVIEERVEIGTNRIIDNKKGNFLLNDTTSNVIMWASGKLMVYYSMATHFDWEMPDYSTLNIYYFKDDSTRIDSLAPKVWYIGNNYNYWIDSCLQPPEYVTHWYWGHFMWEYTYYDNVQEGDTIRFTYFSDDIRSQQPTEFGILGKVQGYTLLGNYDECINDYDNVLEIYVDILPGELFVSIEPEIIYPGDTANVLIRKKMPDGSIEEFDTTQTFEVGMLEGCMSGKLIVGTPPDTGSYFYNVHQPIRFAAADSLVGDSTGTVIIQVGVVDSVEERIDREKRLSGIMPDSVIKKIKGKFREKKPESDDLSISCFNPSFWRTVEPKRDTATIKKNTILLGETKYYQSKRNISTSKLKIEEIEPDANGIPQRRTGTVDGWEWLTTDVWGNDPVSVVDTCSNCGKKMGVYWEKKYPTNEFDVETIGQKKYRIVKMDSLDAGLMRLIGRYWTPDSVYTVNLKANYNNDSTNIKITVEKPNKLGNTYTYTTDVLDENLNIDSLIIKYSGENGLSPFLTKGQMFQEAKKVGGEFKPSYRYEPFYEVFNIRKAGLTNQYFNTNLPFVVDSLGMGSGNPIPATHTNVYPISYPTSPVKIGQYFYNNFNEYRKNLNDGTISIIGSKVATKRWNQLYDYYIDSLEYQPTVAKQKAIDTLKIEIRDGLLDTLFSEYAQTRKISSYGFLQILGITPTDKQYYSKTDASKPPEKINEQDILMPMYVWLIDKNLKTSMNNEVPTNNWPKGYEAELTRSLFYYNQDIDYAKSVYNHSKNFKPEN